jgi:hypothetical protein
VSEPLARFSLQYASATGNFDSTPAQLTELSGSLAPGQYVLVQEAQGAGGTTPLPAPFLTDPNPIAMSATTRGANRGTAASSECDKREKALVQDATRVFCGGWAPAAVPGRDGASLMDWYYPCAPVSSGLTVTAGGGAAICTALCTASRRLAGQLEAGELLKRRADLDVEGGLECLSLVHHGEPRCELRGHRQAPGPEGGDELFPGRDHFIETE